MSNEHLPYYKWYWQDWRANRKVQRMSYVERGLYRELLDECWIEGSIPDDISELADICGCPEQIMADAWQTLSKCFVLDGTVWRNEKLESMRTERDQQRIKKAESGRLGGLAKSMKAKEIVADAKQVLSTRHIAEQSRAEESRAKQSKAKQLPNDFLINDKHRELAKELGVNVQHEFEKFMDYCLANAKKYTNWNSAFNNWIRNASQYKSKKLQQPISFDDIEYGESGLIK